MALDIRHPEMHLLYLRRDLAGAFGERVLTAARVGGLLARGRRPDEIARELDISPGTVDAAVRLLRNTGAEAA
jgi:hypothetical protein